MCMKKGGQILSATDLDSMTYTLATLKVYWCYSWCAPIKVSLYTTGVAEITPGSSYDG
jgi:hypothetical protein